MAQKNMTARTAKSSKAPKGSVVAKAKANGKKAAGKANVESKTARKAARPEPQIEKAKAALKKASVTTMTETPKAKIASKAKTEDKAKTQPPVKMKAKAGVKPAPEAKVNAEPKETAVANETAKKAEAKPSKSEAKARSRKISIEIAANEAASALLAKWSALYKKVDQIDSKPYNMKSVFEEKTGIMHKVLGWGYILANRNDRLEVLFKDGIKYLISNYKS